jgi:hypothetical protein
LGKKGVSNTAESAGIAEFKPIMVLLTPQLFKVKVLRGMVIPKVMPAKLIVATIKIIFLKLFEAFIAVKNY